MGLSFRKNPNTTFLSSILCFKQRIQSYGRPSREAKQLFYSWSRVFTGETKLKPPKGTETLWSPEPAGDHRDGLKGSSTAAHNTCHHSSVRAFPSMRRSHPCLLAPLSISSVPKGYRIPMVGLPMQSWKDPAAGVMSPAGLVLLSTVFPQKKHQNLWQEKKTTPHPGSFGNLGGIDQEVAPPGLHLQKFAL